MAIEIEHKYLVIDDSYKALSDKQVEIMQGYLSRDPEHTVRIRICGDEGSLTIKGKTTVTHVWNLNMAYRLMMRGK